MCLTTTFVVVVSALVLYQLSFVGEKAQVLDNPQKCVLSPSSTTSPFLSDSSLRSWLDVQQQTKKHGNTPQPSCRRILVPLPNLGFDATEMAMPISLLMTLGHSITFATEDGRPSEGADPHTLTGFFGGTLAAPSPDAVADYKAVTDSRAFQNPASFSQLSDIHSNSPFDAVVLVGGHHPGMTEFLVNQPLHDFLTTMINENEKSVIVSAICHGTLHLTRSGDLLKGKQYTSVPRRLERLGYLLSHWLVGMDSATYQLSTTENRYTQDEMEEIGFFTDGAKTAAADVLVDPLFPPSWDQSSIEKGVVIQDGNLVTSRFWGDAPAFAVAIVNAINGLEKK